MEFSWPKWRFFHEKSPTTESYKIQLCQSARIAGVFLHVSFVCSLQSIRQSLMKANQRSNKKVSGEGVRAKNISFAPSTIVISFDLFSSRKLDKKPKMPVMQAKLYNCRSGQEKYLNYVIYYLNALGNTLDWSHQKVLKNNPGFEFLSAGDHEGVTRKC